MKTNFNFCIVPIANGFLLHVSKTMDVCRGLSAGQAIPEPVYVASPAEAGKCIAEHLKAEQARQAAIEQARQTLADAN